MLLRRLRQARDEHGIRHRCDRQTRGFVQCGAGGMPAIKEAHPTPAGLPSGAEKGFERELDIGPESTSSNFSARRV